MVTIRKSIDIKRPLGEVFAYASAPNHLPEVWPSLVEVTNVKTKPDGKLGFDWVYKMAGIRLHGHTERTEFQLNRSTTDKTEKGIKSTHRWSYEGKDDSTRVTVEVDYEIPGAVLSKLAEPFVRRLNEREAEVLLANLKARLEEGELRPRPEAQPHA
jgi:uncharacterized membrane protein